MNLSNVFYKAGIPLLLLTLLFSSGCAPSLKLVKNNFHDYDSLSAELGSLQTNNQDIIKVESIGNTYEERSIFAVRLSGNVLTLNNKPALMAIFAEHGDEHDVTDLAMGIIHYLSDNYGKNDGVTNLLNETEIWIVPMMNPDGVEYDLSGLVKPFSWRKNRRPSGKNTHGVDLNRNWSYKKEFFISKDLPRDLRDKESDFYAGEEPFSEKETRAIRDFLLSHSNIKIFVDYHSGMANFLQGGTGCYSSLLQNNSNQLETNNLCEEIIERFAKEISNSKDKRPAFVAITNKQGANNQLRKYAPFYIKPFVPKKFPPTPGVSGGFVYGKLGIMAIGVEIFRDWDFFKKLPESKTELIKSQVRGILFLLDVLSEN